MNHGLKICLAPKADAGGVVAMRSICLRERLLRFLLGEERKLMVIVPGNSVDEIEITNKPTEVVNEVV